MAMRTPMRVAVVSTLGVALLLLTACTSDKASPRRSSASPTKTAASVNPIDAQARGAILATYNGYLEAYIKASATADFKTQELAQYVGEPLLGQLLNNLYNMSRSGVHNEGRPTWHPDVTELRLDAGEGVVQDCFDATTWNTVGGKAAPTTQAKRYPVVVKAKRVNDKWYVYESTAQRSATC